MAKAVKLFGGFTMDFTADTMAAVAENGAVFVRVKGRHPKYGYGWKAWRKVAAVPAGMTEMDANDACVGRRAYFGADGKPNVRLPN